MMLGVLASFVPLVICLMFPLVGPFLLPGDIPMLSTSRGEGTSLVRGFAFPGRHRTVIRTVLFAGSGVTFLTSRGFGGGALC